MVPPRLAGRKIDPEWAQRNRMLRTGEPFTADEAAKLHDAMQHADPSGGLENCWQERNVSSSARPRLYRPGPSREGDCEAMRRDTAAEHVLLGGSTTVLGWLADLDPVVPGQARKPI